MKMCSDVQNRVGTLHIKMCSDVHTKVGTPHMKMCSDGQNRVGTPLFPSGGIHVDQDRRKKAGLKLGQEGVRGQHSFSLSNVANEDTYLLISTCLFNTS